MMTDEQRLREFKKNPWIGISAKFKDLISYLGQRKERKKNIHTTQSTILFCLFFRVDLFFNTIAEYYVRVFIPKYSLFFCVEDKILKKERNYFYEFRFSFKFIYLLFHTKGERKFPFFNFLNLGEAKAFFYTPVYNGADFVI